MSRVISGPLISSPHEQADLRSASFPDDLNPAEGEVVAVATRILGRKPSNSTLCSTLNPQGGARFTSLRNRCSHPLMLSLILLPMLSACVSSLQPPPASLDGEDRIREHPTVQREAQDVPSQDTPQGHHGDRVKRKRGSTERYKTADQDPNYSRTSKDTQSPERDSQSDPKQSDSIDRIDLALKELASRPQSNTSEGTTINNADEGRKQLFSTASPARGALEPSGIRTLFPADKLGILSVDEEGVILLRDPSSPQEKVYRIGKLPQRTDSVAFSADHSLLAYATEEEVTIMPITGEGRTRRLTHLPAKIVAMEISPDGGALLMGGSDGRVYRWLFLDEERGTRHGDLILERYIGHNTIVGTVRHHSFGRVFFSGDWGGAVVAWLPYDADEFGGKYDKNPFSSRYYTDEPTKMVGGRLGTPVEHMATSRDGEWLVTGTGDGEIRLWKVRGFKEVAKVAAHEGVIFDLTMTPNSKKIITIGRDGEVKSWEIIEAKGAKKSYELKLSASLSVPMARRVVVLNDGSAFVGEASGRITKLPL